MLVHQDLTVEGTREDLERFLSVVDGLVATTDGWSREPDSERSLNELASIFPVNYGRCYRFESDAPPSSRLWIASREDGSLWVCNIVPDSRENLSRTEYNEILSEFATDFALRAAEQSGVDAVLTRAEQDLEDWTTNEAARSLRAFSDCANKSTGSGHPSDKMRFHAFIVSSHNTEQTIPTDLMRRWLVSDGWTEERAIDLVIEYERGLDLLRYYDRQ